MIRHPTRAVHDPPFDMLRAILGVASLMRTEPAYAAIAFAFSTASSIVPTM
jgi:hypothetical protein